LVKPGETLELPFRVSRVDALFQYGAGKARSFHLHELVYQDVARRA
jgi:hypothetical protein